jgi:hypothetical protein
MSRTQRRRDRPSNGIKEIAQVLDIFGVANKRESDRVDGLHGAQLLREGKDEREKEGEERVNKGRVKEQNACVDLEIDFVLFIESRGLEVCVGKVQTFLQQSAAANDLTNHIGA